MNVSVFRLSRGLVAFFAPPLSMAAEFCRSGFVAIVQPAGAVEDVALECGDIIAARDFQKGSSIKSGHHASFSLGDTAEHEALRLSLRELYNAKRRLDNYDRLQCEGVLLTRENRMNALATVFKINSLEENALLRAHRHLARHLHPDKTQPVLEAIWGTERATPFVRTFQRLQAALDQAHLMLHEQEPDFIHPPAGVDAFYTGSGCSLSLWLTVDAMQSDSAVNDNEDPCTFVQIEIPDGTDQYMICTLSACALDDKKLDIELSADCFPWLFEPSLYEDGLQISLRRIDTKGGQSEDVAIIVQHLFGTETAQGDAEHQGGDGDVDSVIMAKLDEVLAGLIPTNMTLEKDAESREGINRYHKRRRRGRRRGRSSALASLGRQLEELQAKLNKHLSSHRWERRSWSNRQRAPWRR